MLNFEKIKFWINIRGQSENLRRHTKFRQNRMIKLLFKFDFGILITFGYIAILVFSHFACKMPNHAHFGEFWGLLPQNLTLIILTPK